MRHKLKPGLNIINLLKKIGRVLNYCVDTEVIVEADENSAVDIAWFFEKNQKYPLMIFEVESKSGNSMVANPLKVFSQNNRKFEKPLFFFHIILSGGKKSNKIIQLEEQYGKFNYRIYRFSLNEHTELMKDILSQHRRLTNDINIISLVKIIDNEWKEINLDDLIVHLEQIRFEDESGNIIPSYATLSCIDLKYSKYLYNYLRNIFLNKKLRNHNFNYKNYFSSFFGYPIHLGILSTVETDLNFCKDYFYEFIWWQEKSTDMKYIASNFGLNRDYDIFILGFSGIYLMMLSLLFDKIEISHEYISKILFDIIEKSKKFNFMITFYNSLWLLYLTCRHEKLHIFFNKVSSYINDNGGLPESLFKRPPASIFSIFDNDECILEQYNENEFIQVPIVNFFKNRINLNKDNILKLAFNFLVNEEIYSTMENYIIL